MTQAKNSRADRKQETRERIMEAAARLYLERGLDGVSLDEVARAAERTKGAVYGHFADKESLLIEVWRAHYARKRALIEAALARSRDAATMRVELARAMADVFALGAWPALAVDVRRRPEYQTLAGELAALEGAELDALTRHFVDFGPRVGLPTPADPQETAATLFALAEGLMLREKLSPEIAARRFLTVLGALLGAAR
jgi:AcrR family transcriptional regulator